MEYVPLKEIEAARNALPTIVRRLPFCRCLGVPRAFAPGTSPSTRRNDEPESARARPTCAALLGASVRSCHPRALLGIVPPVTIADQRAATKTVSSVAD